MKAQIKLEDGISQTYNWFLENIDKLKTSLLEFKLISWYYY